MRKTRSPFGVLRGSRVAPDVISELWRRLYEEQPSRYIEAAELVAQELRAYIRSECAIPAAEARSRVTARIKDFDEIVMKVDKPDRHEQPPNITTIEELENEIRGIARVLVVVNILSEVDSVEDFIFKRSESGIWKVEKVEDFTDTADVMKGPIGRGYQSRHFNLAVYPLPPYGHDVWVELQVRTRNQNSWASWVSWGVSRGSTSDPPQVEDAEFQAAIDFYETNRSTLLKEYEGKFIAIIGGKVVAWDEDFEELALRVYQRFGYRDIFMPKVERKPRILRVPSPRLRA